VSNVRKSEKRIAARQAVRIIGGKVLFESYAMKPGRHVVGESGSKRNGGPSPSDPNYGRWGQNSGSLDRDGSGGREELDGGRIRGAD